MSIASLIGLESYAVRLFIFQCSPSRLFWCDFFPFFCGCPTGSEIILMLFEVARNQTGAFGEFLCSLLLLPLMLGFHEDNE
jgi:hypothetical protein